MALSLRDCTFFGSALPQPFVEFELEKQLLKKSPLPKTAGPAGKTLQKQWDGIRQKLRKLGETGGSIRVANHVLEPLLGLLVYAKLEAAPAVNTREGEEDGGRLFVSGDGKSRLRAWSIDANVDFDAPNRRGRAFRFSPSQVASRVLQATGERLGLITDGQELRLLFADPARPDSHVSIQLDGWRRSREIPDSLRLLIALGSPAGVAALPAIIEQARLAQVRVTKELRKQAQAAVLGFVQHILDAPENQTALAGRDREQLAKDLWKEGLVLVYRLLFIFKLEASSDPARAFSFASSSLWRTSYSPNLALADHVRAFLDQGRDTGYFLAQSLRTTFRLFETGLSSSELKVSPLGGMLFGTDALALFDQLYWPERAVALLLHNLLWTDGKEGRARVHYGPLDVEDLGRVYEALLELEPGIATEPMCRLRRQKLEVVVLLAQGAAYRSESGSDDDDAYAEEAEDSDEPKKGKATVLFVEEIAQGRFFLRVGLGRKATGSYYTPEPFVRFLVQETLGPQVAQRSPPDDPQPGLILALKVLDPAMGSGHFLVGACRFLAVQLYEACRLCDDLAATAEKAAEGTTSDAARKQHLERAKALRQRILDLPDPNDEMVGYLPSRAPEGQDLGLSQAKGMALCRRLVAVHSLYGVDKNPLAVELAKLALWLESFAEGWPLTFMDHRLVCGDSLSGPSMEHLLTYPLSSLPLGDLFSSGLRDRIGVAVVNALRQVRALEASIGKDVADLETKRVAKSQFDAVLAPFRLLAAAWAGGVRLGEGKCDQPGYGELARVLLDRGDVDAFLSKHAQVRDMVSAGISALPYELWFPEVFLPSGLSARSGGFDAVLGNPPWDGVKPSTREFLAAFDLRVLNANTKVERVAFENSVLAMPSAKKAFAAYVSRIEQDHRIYSMIFTHQRAVVDGKTTGGDMDLAKLFAERAYLLSASAFGVVLPGAFHSASGATGLRRLFFGSGAVGKLLSFNNSRSLFEIEGKVKFDLVVGQHKGASDGCWCSFDCSSFSDLERSEASVFISTDALRVTGGPYLTLVETGAGLASQIASHLAVGKWTWGAWCQARGLRFKSEFHPTNDAKWLRPASSECNKADPRDPEVLNSLRAKGFVVVANEDSIHSFDDHWPERPRYVARASDIKPAWTRESSRYRLLYRRIANVVDLRSMKAAIVPPGWVTASPYISVREDDAAEDVLLVAAGILNSFVFDWALRTRLTATLSPFIVRNLPAPRLQPSEERFLSYSALALSVNHRGYLGLWRAVVAGDALPASFPLLSDPSKRWAVRAAIDAVVAEAYGISREQYAFVLDSFSHRSFPDAPKLCLAAFDELQATGFDNFQQSHNPLRGFPLNAVLAKPVVEFVAPPEKLPGERAPSVQRALFGLESSPTPKKKGGT